MLRFSVGLIKNQTRFVASTANRRKPQDVRLHNTESKARVLSSQEVVENIKKLGMNFKEILPLALSKPFKEIIDACIAETYRLHQVNATQPDNVNTRAFMNSPFSQVLEALAKVGKEKPGNKNSQLAWAIIELSRKDRILAQSIGVQRMCHVLRVLPNNPEAPGFEPSESKLKNNAQNFADILADWVLYCESNDVQRQYLKKFLMWYVHALPNTYAMVDVTFQLFKSLQKLINKDINSNSNERKRSPGALESVMFDFLHQHRLLRDLDIGADLEDIGPLLLQKLLAENIVQPDLFSPSNTRIFASVLFLSKRKEAVRRFDLSAMRSLFNAISRDNSAVQIHLRSEVIMTWKTIGETKLFKEFAESILAGRSEERGEESRTKILGGTGASVMPNSTLDGTPLLLGQRCCHNILEALMEKADGENNPAAQRQLTQHPSYRWMKVMRDEYKLTHAGDYRSKLLESVPAGSQFSEDICKDLVFGPNLQTYVRLFIKNKYAKLREKQDDRATAHDLLAWMAEDEIIPDVKLLVMLSIKAREDRDFQLSTKVLDLGHALCFHAPRGSLRNVRQPSIMQDEVSRLSETVNTVPPTSRMGGAPKEMPTNEELSLLYNNAIDTAQLSNLPDDCLFLMFAMTDVGLKPDSQSIFYILKALQQREEHGKVLHLFSLMRKWGLPHEPKHITCVVQSFTALGRLGEAYKSLCYLHSVEGEQPQMRRTAEGSIVAVPSPQWAKRYTYFKLFDYLILAMRTKGNKLHDIKVVNKAAKRTVLKYEERENVTRTFEPHNMSEAEIVEAAIGTLIFGLELEAKTGDTGQYIDWDHASTHMLRCTPRQQDLLFQSLRKRYPECAEEFIKHVQSFKEARIEMHNQLVEKHAEYAHAQRASRSAADIASTTE